MIRDVPEALVLALKERAAANGRSAEAEHRLILEEALLSGRNGFRERAGGLRTRDCRQDSGRLSRPHPGGSRLRVTIVAAASVGRTAGRKTGGGAGGELIETDLAVPSRGCTRPAKAYRRRTLYNRLTVAEAVESILVIWSRGRRLPFLEDGGM